MTVLITGATGLVGERLLPRLLKDGVACRILLRGDKEGPEGAEVARADILDPSSLTDAVRDVSAVIHLAAVFRTQDTDLIWKSNLEGTRNLVAAVKAQSPSARFILSSTSHVYDRDTPHPGREDDTVNPQHAYPASKVAAENHLRQSGLNWAVIRFPFVYGDGDGHLQELPKHIAAWHPAQRMSTVHHRDIARAMKLALDGLFDRQIVNIADDAAMSVYELASLMGSELQPSREPLEHPWYLHIDASRARSAGFEASIRTVYQAAQDGIL
jgi:UDP-glucose 4-epimerase